MKKENLIVIFYVLYFAWLFTVTYLNPDTMLTNYFTGAVALFYLLLLREKWDFLVFPLAACIPVVLTTFSFSNWEIGYEPELLPLMPLWLPLAWGTTVSALRKLYIDVVNKV